MSAEYDPQMKTQFAQQSYRLLHPDVDVRGDVHGIDERDVPDHDVLTFTPPCQAFSVAGKRLGFEDMRGSLVFEALRIAKYKRPKALFMENVKGLVGHDGGKTLDTIIHAINEIGYTVDFNVLNSKYFGVPQNRERIFIIALRDDLITPEPWTIEGTTVVPKGKRRISEYEGVKTFNFDWPEHGEVTTRLRDVLEPQVDERYYLSEDKTAALVAQLEVKGEDTIVKRDGHGYHEFDKISPTLTANAGTGGNNMPFILDTKPKDAFRIYADTCPTLQANDYKEPKQVVEPQMIGHIDMQGHDICKRVYSRDGVSPSVPTGVSGGTTPKVAQPILAGSLDHYGNDQMNRVYSAEGIAPTLTVPSGGGREQKIAEDGPRYRIRKLTPRECWRLQNFSDEAFDTVKAAGLSDSQLYKQAGNSITVSVVEALGRQLLPLIYRSDC